MKYHRPTQLNLAMTALLLALPCGCAFGSTATANTIATPVLVGPVERIGGSAREHMADAEAPRFDAKVDHTLTASSSSETKGNITTTTTTTTLLGTDASLVDAKILEATAGDTDRLVHIDRLRVNSYSGFFYSAAWISSRVRVKGHIGRKI